MQFHKVEGAQDGKLVCKNKTELQPELWQQCYGSDFVCVVGADPPLPRPFQQVSAESWG